MKYQIAGYKELSQHGIVHRDIKPENIFVHNNKIYKLAEFILFIIL